MHNAEFQTLLRTESFLDTDNILFKDDFFEGGYAKDLALADESDPVGKFSPVADRGSWLVTIIDGDTDALETIAIADDGHGGILNLTTNDKDNDALSIQLNGEAVALASGRRIHYKARVRVNDADTCDWFAGLSIADTDILGGTTDSLGFRVPAGDSAQDLTFMTEKDSVETTTDTGVNVADSTWLILEFICHGTDRVDCFVNNSAVASHTANLPDNEALSPVFEIRNASAAASIMGIDYIVILADR